jgi:hypothetical protein
MSWGGGDPINGRWPGRIHSLALVIRAGPVPLGPFLLYSFCTVVMPNQEASRHCAHTGQIDLGLRHDTLLSEVVTLTRPIFL